MSETILLSMKLSRVPGMCVSSVGKFLMACAWGTHFSGIICNHHFPAGSLKQHCLFPHIFCDRPMCLAPE